MKTSNKLLYCFTVFLLVGASAQGQFLKKLSKKAQKAAERTVERRVEKEEEESSQISLP